MSTLCSTANVFDSTVFHSTVLSGSQGARECNLDSEKWRTVEKIKGLARRKGNVVDAAGVFASVGCPWGVNDVVDCVQPPLTVGGAGLPLGVIPP